MTSAVFASQSHMLLSGLADDSAHTLSQHVSRHGPGGPQHCLGCGFRSQHACCVRLLLLRPLAFVFCSRRRRAGGPRVWGSRRAPASTAPGHRPDPQGWYGRLDLSEGCLPCVLSCVRANTPGFQSSGMWSSLPPLSRHIAPCSLRSTACTCRPVPPDTLILCSCAWGVWGGHRVRVLCCCA